MYALKFAVGGLALAGAAHIPGYGDGMTSLGLTIGGSAPIADGIKTSTSSASPLASIEGYCSVSTLTKTIFLTLPASSALSKPPALFLLPTTTATTAGIYEFSAANSTTYWRNGIAATSPGTAAETLQGESTGLTTTNTIVSLRTLTSTAVPIDGTASSSTTQTIVVTETGTITSTVHVMPQEVSRTLASSTTIATIPKLGTAVSTPNTVVDTTSVLASAQISSTEKELTVSETRSHTITVSQSLTAITTASAKSSVLVGADWNSSVSISHAWYDLSVTEPTIASITDASTTEFATFPNASETTNLTLAAGANSPTPDGSILASVTNSAVPASSTNFTAPSSPTPHDISSNSSYAMVSRPTSSEPTLAVAVPIVPSLEYGKSHPCGEAGSFVVNWDDEVVYVPGPGGPAAAPVFNPYHGLFFANGFTYYSPSTANSSCDMGWNTSFCVPIGFEPYNPISGPNIAIFHVNTTATLGDYDKLDEYGLLPGSIGDGPRASDQDFWFNATSADLGCDNGGTHHCNMTITGYKYDVETDTEIKFISQEAAIPPCEAVEDCKLSHVVLPGFEGLSTVRFEAVVDGASLKSWVIDNLSLGWYNNSCASGEARASLGGRVNGDTRSGRNT